MGLLVCLNVSLGGQRNVACTRLVRQFVRAGIGKDALPVYYCFSHLLMIDCFWTDCRRICWEYGVFCSPSFFGDLRRVAYLRSKEGAGLFLPLAFT